MTFSNKKLAIIIIIACITISFVVLFYNSISISNNDDIFATQNVSTNESIQNNALSNNCTNDHSTYTALQIPTGEKALTNGSYYINNKTSSLWTGFFSIGMGQTVTLCLDGTKNFKSSGTDCTAIILNGGTLILNDCSSNKTGELGIQSSSLESDAPLIINNGTGSIYINGGTISANTGNAIYNAGGGNIFISGGSISATTGIAINNQGTGNIYINEKSSSNPTIITSGNTVSDKGTISLSYGSNAKAVLEINGGTIKNTASGNAIHNYTELCDVNINGGTISAKSGYALYNNSNFASATISGGNVSAESGTAVFHKSAGTLNISGGMISATTGVAIRGGGNININNNATITSQNITPTEGTIILTENYSYSVLIQGGIIENIASGNAIYNAGLANLDIKGGNIKAVGGLAIDNISLGKVTISGTATISTENSINSTILIRQGIANLPILDIQGGTIQHLHANISCASTILNEGNGTILISGGTIHEASTNHLSYAIDSNNIILQNSPTIIGNISTNTAINTSAYTEKDSNSNSQILNIYWENPTQNTTIVSNFINEKSFAFIDNDGWSLFPGENLTANSLVSWESVVITFHSNSGVGTMPPQNIKKGVETKLKTNTFAKSDYIFENWNTLELGNGTTYANNGKINTITDTNLYAQWKINKCRVTFDNNGADSSAIDEQIINPGNSVTKPQNPTKKGHSFKGWYNGEVAFDFNTSVTTPLTLTAKWEVNIYTITWIIDGKESKTTCAYGEIPTFDGTPTKESNDKFTYSFKAWDKTPAKATENATYTAIFDEVAKVVPAKSLKNYIIIFSIILLIETLLLIVVFIRKKKHDKKIKNNKIAYALLFLGFPLSEILILAAISILIILEAIYIAKNLFIKKQEQTEECNNEEIQQPTENNEECPIVEEPTEESPIVEEPTEESPIVEEPIEESPIAEEPTEESPIVEEPIEESPIVEEPIEESTIAEEPTEESPIVEEPIEESPIAEEPTEESPIVEEPTEESPIVEEPTEERPIVEEPTEESPIAEEPIEENNLEQEDTAKEEIASFAITEEDLMATSTSFSINKKLLAEEMIRLSNEELEIIQRGEVEKFFRQPDTYYTPNATIAKGKKARRCFLFAYDLKDGVMKLILKFDTKEANEIKEKYPTFIRSKFPRGKNWYMLRIDDSFASIDEITSLLIRSRHFMEK